MNLTEKIEQLKKEKKAVILAHNYQRPEIQDIADYTGDSIELSRQAAEEKDAKILVFSAVDFMAESAAILNPEKTVLLPSSGARCPMAQMLPLTQVKMWKKKYPKIPLVLYVNTLAEAKTECEVCCTSANAVEVIKAIDADTLLFGPDTNLAWYVQQKTGKKIIPIPPGGFCPTHLLFMKEDALLRKQEHSNAVVMAHPECSPDVQEIADFIGSTSQMCKYAKSSSSQKFIVATETGLLHRLKKENPTKEFYSAYEGGVCPNMKLNTLERIYLALKTEQTRITVPVAVAKKAKDALEKMYKLTS
ncbi:MAG: quinolinate synthase NadA [Candidatus Bathyarchaeia archaeon]